jgi:ribosomal protein L12E/L44/L45/RPP1/RPP2
MSAIIGALRVVLGADTAIFETKMKEAASSLTAFGGHLAKFGAIAGAGFSAAATGLAIGVKKTIDEADQLSKVSQKIGIPVEELSRLKYAGELADVSMESLSKSVIKMSNALAEAARDPASEAGRAFAAIGVQVKNAEGSLREGGEVIKDVAEKFSGYRDSAAKTALAVAIFGKAGADMIPLLNLGRQGLADAADEAERYGLVMKSETAVAAEEFNDNLKRMQLINQGIVTQLTAEMLPAFKGLSDAMLKSKENSELMTTVSAGLVTGLRMLVSTAVAGIAVFERLGAEISAFWQVMSRVTTTNWLTGDQQREALKNAWDQYIAEGEKTKAVIENLKSTIAGFWESGAIANNPWESQAAGLTRLSESVRNYAKAWTQTNAPVISGIAGQKNAVEAFLAAQEKRRQALEAEAQTIGKSAGEQERLRIVLQAETIAKENNISITEALRQRIEATASAYGDIATRVERSKQAFQSAQEMQQFFGQQVSGVFSDLVSGANNFSDSMRRVAKAIADAIIQAVILGTGPLASLFGMQGMNGATGGLIGMLFSGLTGFANGGSFVVGGSGGIDSQIAAFRATPGERVTISNDDRPVGASATFVINSSPTFYNADPASEARMRAFSIEAARQAVKEAKLGIAKANLGYALG